MHPTRKYFLKLFVFSLILALVFSAWKIAVPWQKPLWLLCLVFFTLMIVYPVGQPLHWLWKRYLDRTTQGKRFFQGAGLVFLLVALYRMYYIAVGGDVRVFEKITQGFFPPGDYALWGAAGLALFVFGLIRVMADGLFSLWMELALFIQKIVSRIILTIIYLLTVLPISLVGRLFGKEFLALKKNPNATTYWENREAIPYQEKRYRRHF